MEAIILQTPQKARYRFGTAGLDATAINRTSHFFHSDTLFSALVNCHAQVSDKTDAFVQSFLENVSTSSGCFCFEKNGRFLLFFHKPLFLNLLIENDTHFKRFKNIQYISQGVWETGVLPDQALDPNSDYTTIGKHFLCTKRELRSLGSHYLDMVDFEPFNVQILPKVTIHTAEDTERLFFQASVRLQGRGHLQTHFYFLLKDSKKLITDSLLEILACNGIGGELNVGCGKVDTVLRKTVNLNVTNDWQVAQSLIFPQNLDEIKQVQHYRTITRGGRRLGNNGQWLHQINGFGEGCLMLKPDLGHCPNLSPVATKKYLRYGKSLGLPIHENWQNAIENHQTKHQ